MDSSTASWTPERIREYVLAHHRERYRRGLLWLRQLERDNADSRRSGMSYRARDEKYGRRIRYLHETLPKEEAAGKAASRQAYDADAIVSHFGEERVAAYGFEQAVRDFYDLWEPFGAEVIPTPDVAVQPVE